MSNLKLEVTEFYRDLKMLGTPDKEISSLLEYFKACDEIIEEGVKEGWLDAKDYQTYLKKIINRKSLSGDEIERFYQYMAGLIVTKHYKKAMPAKTYYEYLGVSELAYDCIRTIAPTKYCRISMI